MIHADESMSAMLTFFTQQNPSGTLATRTWARGVVSSYTYNDNGTFAPCYDANGNITDYLTLTSDISQLTSGATAASYEYSPFGETIASSGDLANTFAFRFSTKCWEDESCLYYYGYRFYSPEMGRWLNRDPIEEVGGVNTYGFVGNTSLTRIDLLGLVAAAWGPPPSPPQLPPTQPESLYLALIKIAESFTPPPEGKNCIYLPFYYSGTNWASNEDNNWLSHVAIGLPGQDPIGFNPIKDGKRIVKEDRVDIMAIYRCCFCDPNGAKINAIKRFLENHVNKRTYNGEPWRVYGQNCATFASDALALGFDKKTEWDSNWIGCGEQPRPEEMRQALAGIEDCEVLYTNPEWKGTTQSTK